MSLSSSKPQILHTLKPSLGASPVQTSSSAAPPDFSQLHFQPLVKKSRFHMGLWIAGALLALGLGALIYFQQDIWRYVLAEQRQWHHQLASQLQILKTQINWHAIATLWGLSFAYGVFHALGPGHGKAILSTYSLTQGHHWRSSAGLALLASLLQGVVAILLVVVSTLLLDQVARKALTHATQLESYSFILLMGLGIYLIGSALYAGWRKKTTCGCGHSHTHPKQQASFYATALSVGLRPCSGALLVLIIASLLDILALGIGAVLCMALGTGLTVAALTVASVQARTWIFDASSAQQWRYTGLVLKSLGGALMFWLGWGLYQSAQVQGAHPILG
ncbi:ABC-type nickel/cobalt efflux system, permease component RcnA [Allopseudospirillum japonicum]|uniref:Nickel/cobalt efflux system n=1 Tax=Allopseudospirillum japonicum TaxID=64971 RepID=A0A1H6SF98_9GAMM|nr:hypothetical protein [Allopseudospirillum japonicum]SEI66613.1 ABC-type nickel/cobalt efflux system, permease component RcnA [Allopseudospirillum japonicum]